jgi:hypothetical protein
VAGEEYEAFLMIGTFKSRDDLYHTHILKEEYDSWDKFIEPLYKATPSGKVAFFPALYPLEIEETLKKKYGPRYYPEYMLEVVDETNKEFPDDCWQTIAEDKIPTDLKTMYIVYDPAGEGQNAEVASYDCIMVNAFDYEFREYVMACDMVQGRKPNRVVDSLIYYAKKYAGLYPTAFKGIIIEGNSFDKWMRQNLYNEFLAQELDFRVIRSDPHSYQNRGKDESIRVFQPRWQSKSLFFSEAIPEATRVMIKTAFHDFPMTAVKDPLDCIAMVEKQTRFSLPDVDVRVPPEKVVFNEELSGLTVNLDLLVAAQTEQQERMMEELD